MRKDEIHIGVLHIAEARIVAARAERIAADIRKKVRDYCVSTEVTAFETHLRFEGVKATMALAEEGLRIRVEARDLVMFHGIQILLQTAISKAVSASQVRADWCASPSSGLERFWTEVERSRTGTRFVGSRSHNRHRSRQI